jgi:tRNA(fMet)-specific endonuclease VapC
VFVVLDTNHYVELIDGSTLGANLQRRAAAVAAEVFTTIVTGQEITQGWLAVINRNPPGLRQLNGYDQFQRHLLRFSRIGLLPFDPEAVQQFDRLRRLRLRVGTMDLKIAAICLAHDATLLTRNAIDFRKVPGLRFENWLD